jgi:hypothetical protein
MYYSYALNKVATLDELVSAFVQAHQKFFDAADNVDLTGAACCDEFCMRCNDELADLCSRDRAEDSHRHLLILAQVEESTKERADVLCKMITVRHRTRKTARELVLTHNGFAAARITPHKFGDIATHGHMYASN